MNRPYMRILHFVPETYLLPDYRFHGSTKDIATRAQYFHEKGIDVFFVPVTSRALGLADVLRGKGLANATHVVIDVPLHGDDLAYIRNRWRYAKLIFRSHNAQLPHRVDTLRAAQMSPALAEFVGQAEHNIQVFAERDKAAAAVADCILSIEPISTVEDYWRQLGFRGELLSAPYFLADTYLDQLSLERKPVQGERDNAIVCVTSGHPGPLIYDLLLNFHIAVGRLQNAKPEWRFRVTGKPVEWFDGDPRRAPRIDHLGLVDDPIGIIAECRALAVLSDLGWGFKTKILDGIAGHAWVLVTQQLLARLPDALKPYCIAVDPGSESGLAEAIEELERMLWPPGNPNLLLRNEAYSALDVAILEESSEQMHQAQ